MKGPEAAAAKIANRKAAFPSYQFNYLTYK